MRHRYGLGVEQTHWDCLKRLLLVDQNIPTIAETSSTRRPSLSVSNAGSASAGSPTALQKTIGQYGCNGHIEICVRTVNIAQLTDRLTH